MKMTKEERSEDIDVIQAPIDYERRERSMATSAANLATDPTLAKEVEYDLKMYEKEVQAQVSRHPEVNI